MIEVLVASAILTVIVMMLGMIFQQSSLAWRSGSKRAEGFMQVRSLIGAIQRDASQAIDVEGVKAYRKRINPTDNLSLEDQKFTGSSLTFYTLTGTNRSLSKVSYDLSCNRREDVLDANSGSWKQGQTYNVMTYIERQSNANTPSVNIKSFDAEWESGYNGPNGDRGLPLYTTVQATVQSSGYTLEIGAASAGPDQEWGTKDDITTWNKQ